MSMFNEKVNSLFYKSNSKIYFCWIRYHFIQPAVIEKYKHNSPSVINLRNTFESTRNIKIIVKCSFSKQNAIDEYRNTLIVSFSRTKLIHFWLYGKYLTLHNNNPVAYYDTTISCTRLSLWTVFCLIFYPLCTVFFISFHTW